MRLEDAAKEVISDARRPRSKHVREFLTLLKDRGFTESACARKLRMSLLNGEMRTKREKQFCRMILQEIDKS